VRTPYWIAEVIIYALGLLLWLFLWKWLVGYKQLNEKKILWISFIGAIASFVINILLVIPSTSVSYETELSVYAYVEDNAKTIAQLSLAIALFVVVSLGKGSELIDAVSRKRFVYLLLWSFLIAIVGCLPLYWIPPIASWLGVLRHLKTIPYIYSLYLLSTAITVFIYNLHFQMVKREHVHVQKK
jgi:hypothetical protein